MVDAAPEVPSTPPDAYPEWEGRPASDYELAVRIDTRADGPIVVLLHGLNSDATDWQPVIDDFPMDYRIIAVDLLGYGESPKPVDIDYSCADHVAAIHNTLAKLDLGDQFLLVGYSLGGDIALNYAATYPEEVRRLFLLSAPFYLSAEGLQPRPRHRLAAAVDRRSLREMQNLLFKIKRDYRVAHKRYSQTHGFNAYANRSTLIHSHRQPGHQL